MWMNTSSVGLSTTFLMRLAMRCNVPQKLLGTNSLLGGSDAKGQLSLLLALVLVSCA